MSKIYYQTGQDHGTAAARIMALAASVNGRRRERIFRAADAARLLNVIDEHPEARTVRRYSSDGFVPNSYARRGPAYITRATATRHGKRWEITVETATASRSYGAGSLTTVDNRGL